MKFAKYKTAAFAIAMLFAFSMVTSITVLPNVSAHTPAWQIPTIAFLNVAPNPVGVGQQVSVNFGITVPPPTANGPGGDRWHNFKVTVTQPDGTTETLGPFTSDDTGGTATLYTPTKVGNYTFVFSFPGETLVGANPPISNPATVGDYYQPSTSDKYVLVVQQTPIPAYPETPLPQNYWSRPVFAMNTNWYSISGNWLGTGLTARMQSYFSASGNYNPYTKAPDTAHIMWTRPYAPGGLIGGKYGNNQMNSMYYATAQYEPKFGPPIIMNGVLYYEEEPGASTNIVGWVAIDLHSGKTLWSQNSTTATLRMGQAFDYVSPNQYGGLAYLWAETSGPRFSMYDAMTGQWILDVVNATLRSPSGTFGPSVVFLEGPDGTLQGYYIDSSNYTLNMWNSTRCIQRGASGTGDPNNWMWRPPQGASLPWANGIQWSVPIVTKMTASNGSTVDINAAYAEASGVANNLCIQSFATSDVILVSTLPGPGTAFEQPGYIISEAFDAKTGKLLWGPLNQTTDPWSRLLLTSIGDGVYTIYSCGTTSITAFSLATGQKVWGPVSGPNNAWSHFNQYSIIANGTLYSADLGGFVNAFDDQTGKLLWTFDAGSAGYDTPYGIWPLLHVEAVADGKLYVQTGHEYSPPLFHGANLYCLNATTGEEIWRIFNFPISNYPNAAISDGYMVIADAYDNQIYTFGRGPSATTVSAPSVGVTTATPITIRGTVTDVAAGTRQDAVAGNFPNGLPAVSDDSMTGWMEYVYQQQPCPTNVTGVPVSIDVLDSNGNYRNIGTATSDGSGMFTFTWTPDIPGDFIVIANFAGSGSYYPSNAETSFHASAAATAPPSGPTAAPASIVETYFVPSVIAIILVIIIGFAALFLALRKRP